MSEITVVCITSSGEIAVLSAFSVAGVAVFSSSVAAATGSGVEVTSEDDDWESEDEDWESLLFSPVPVTVIVINTTFLTVGSFCEVAVIVRVLVAPGSVGKVISSVIRLVSDISTGSAVGKPLTGKLSGLSVTSIS